LAIGPGCDLRDMVINNSGVLATLAFAFQRGQERGDW